MLTLLFAAAFQFAVEGETAVVYTDRLQVLPIEQGATNLTVEVAERPRKDNNGKVTLQAKEPFCTFLQGRSVNIAPQAHVTVSSCGKPSQGFQPTPGQNKPESLVDGRINDTKNFEFADRKTPPTESDFEWIVLDWPSTVTVRGLFVLTGCFEAFPRHDRVRVDTYVGTADPRLDTTAGAWKEIAGVWSPEPKNRTSNFGCWRSWTAAETFSSAALRVRFCGGGWILQGKKHEMPVPGLGELAVLSPATDRTTSASVPAKAGVPIDFEMPFDGAATIQVRDAEGRVVANPVTDQKFSRGKQRVMWNLTDLMGNPISDPGAYTWRGVAIPPLRLEYRHSYYPLGLPKDRRTWKTVDKTGGWLADHDPPRGVVRDGDTMWLNAWAEQGDSVIRIDLDMRKLWGGTRFWVTVPQEICVDGGFLYGYAQGGWLGKDEIIIRIDPKTGYRDKKVFQKVNPKDAKSSFLNVTLSGFQVLGDRAFVAFGAENVIRVYDIAKGNASPYRTFGWAIAGKAFDDLKPVLVKEIALPSPGKLRRYGEGHLLTTSGNDVMSIDVETFAVKKLFSTGLEAKLLGCCVGGDGTIWIGAGEPLHQVFGFDATGRCLKTLGKPGRRMLGPWDNDNLEEPAGVEVDAKGRVWVTEHTHWEKRVSVWDPETGRCLKQVLGPTQYGGDGCIDPEDETRLFYRGLEMRRDPNTGEVTPVNLIYRPDAPLCAAFAGGDYPSYCFRADGKLWFTSFQPPHQHPNCVLWQYKTDRVVPVAAVGVVKGFKNGLGETGGLTNSVPAIVAERGMLFAWTDLNDDGRISADEVKTRVLQFNDKPIPGLGIGWNWRMNEKFELACTTDLYQSGRMVYFHPVGRSANGYPIYDIPPETKPGILCAQGAMTDSKGNVVILGQSVVSLTPDGVERWRYRNDWPGLHAGHKTTAAGNEPGVLIAPTRVWGIVPTNGEAGEVVAFNSNLGCSYLMTADDGLYLGRIFRDQRVAPTIWNYNDEPDAQTMTETSLNDEHFGGTFERIKGADGSDHYYYIVGKGHCSVVELKGLDGVRRLAGGTLSVQAEDVFVAQERVAAAAAKKLEPKVATVLRADDKGVWKKDAPVIYDGIRLAYDDVNLYVHSRKNDAQAPFANAGTNPFELFTTGDTLEVMLRTAAPLTKRGVQIGDKRLVLARFEGKPIAVLYDYKLERPDASSRQGFASPWRTAYVDRVSVLESAKVTVATNRSVTTVEATIPLAALGLDPTQMKETRGDVGRVNSDATGTRAASREYWSNKATAIMSDLPTEVMINPDLWGTFRFQ